MEDIELAQYLTEDCTGKLVWYEPLIEGKSLGIEFGLYGPDSDEWAIADENYRKIVNKASGIENEDYRREVIENAAINKVLCIVKSIRSKKKQRIISGDEEITDNNLPKFLRSAPVLLNDIFDYITKRNSPFKDIEEQLEKAVKKYFYLNQQHSEKTSVINPKTHKTESKLNYVRNIDKREKFIKQFGAKQFEVLCESDENYAKLKDEPFPDGTFWIFNHFLEMWYLCEADFCGNKIFKPKDIMDYCNCFGVSLTIPERKLIMKMRNWALNAIAELEKND